MGDDTSLETPPPATGKTWLDTPWHVTLTIICGVLMWSLGFIIYKEVLLYFDPLIAAFARLFTGFCFFCLFFNKKLLRMAKFVQLKHWRIYVFIALCESCFYMVFISYGMRYTTISQAAIIVACLPILVSSLGWLIIKEKPGKGALPGFVIMVAAIAVLNFSSTSSVYAPNPILGNFLVLLAVLCSCGYLISLRGVSLPYPGILSAAVQSFVGSIFMLAAIVVTATPLPAAWPLKPTLLMVMTGLITTFAGYTLMNSCVPKMPLSRFSAYANLVPVCTILLSIVIMGERLSLIQAVCCLAIMLGVYISQQEKNVLPWRRKASGK